MTRAAKSPGRANLHLSRYKVLSMNSPILQTAPGNCIFGRPPSRMSSGKPPKLILASQMPSRTLVDSPYSLSRPSSILHTTPYRSRNLSPSPIWSPSVPPAFISAYKSSLLCLNGIRRGVTRVGIGVNVNLDFAVAVGTGVSVDVGMGVIVAVAVAVDSGFTVGCSVAVVGVG